MSREIPRRANGRFVKKKALERQQKSLEGRKRAKLLKEKKSEIIDAAELIEPVTRPDKNGGAKSPESEKIEGNLEMLQDLKNIVSDNVLNKIAEAGFTTKSLVELYKREGKDKIVQVFSEKVDGKPRISINKKVLGRVIYCLENSASSEE